MRFLVLIGLWAAHASVADAQELVVDGTCPSVEIEVTGMTPGGSVRLMTADGTGADAIPGGPCGGTVTGLSAITASFRLDADAAGEVSLSPTLPESLCGLTVQVIDMATCALSDVSAFPSLLCGLTDASYVEVASFDEPTAHAGTAIGLTFDGTAVWSGSGETDVGIDLGALDPVTFALLDEVDSGLGDLRSVFNRGDGDAPIRLRVAGDRTIYNRSAAGVVSVATTLTGGILDADGAVVWDTLRKAYVAHALGIVDSWDQFGTSLGAFELIGYGTLGSEGDFAPSRKVAVLDGCFLTYADGVVSSWHPDGTRTATAVLEGAGTTYASHWSFSLAQQLVWVIDDAGGTWRGYDLAVGIDAECAIDEDCDDGNPCTADTCDGGVCVQDGTGVLELCDDLSLCTTDDVCLGDAEGTCEGVEVSCDDFIACTTDTCIPETGCENTGDDELCSDGVFCNGPEVCDGEVGCTSSAGLDLDDGIDCTLDICDETTDTIEHLADAALCDDGIACTLDECDPVDGCSNTSQDLLCSDGVFCNGEEECDPLAGCISTSLDIDDGVDCTLDICDETTDTIEHVADGALCDDGIACTLDECDPVDGCSQSSQDFLCSDGLFCNGEELCDPSAGCISTSLDIDDGVDCTLDICNETDDIVQHLTDDALCDDGDPCTENSCDAVLGCVETDLCP